MELKLINLQLHTIKTQHNFSFCCWHTASSAKGSGNQTISLQLYLLNEYLQKPCWYCSCCSKHRVVSRVVSRVRELVSTAGLQVSVKDPEVIYGKRAASKSLDIYAGSKSCVRPGYYEALSCLYQIALFPGSKNEDCLRMTKQSRPLYVSCLDMYSNLVPSSRNLRTQPVWTYVCFLNVYKIDHQKQIGLILSTATKGLSVNAPLFTHTHTHTHIAGYGLPPD